MVLVLCEEFVVVLLVVVGMRVLVVFFDDFW